MDLQLNEAQAQTLTELIYLGNFMVNANRRSNEQLANYMETSEQLFRMIVDNGIRYKGKTFRSLDLLQERLLAELEGLITEFELSALPYTLSKVCADFVYPTTPTDGERLVKRSIAESCYEELFEKFLQNVV